MRRFTLFVATSIVLSLAVGMISAAKPTRQAPPSHALTCDDDNPAIAGVTARIKAAAEAQEKLGYDLSDRAEFYFRAENWRCAIRDYAMASALNPDDSDNWIERGDAYAHVGEYESAIADFTRFIKLEPRDSQGYLERAYAYLDSGDEGHGRADYEAAIRLEAKGDAPSSFISMGAFYLAARNDGAAANAYTAAMKEEAAKIYAASGVASPSDAQLADDATVARHAWDLEKRAADAIKHDHTDEGFAIERTADNFAYDLYGRGLARQRMGQAAAGKGDMDLAEYIVAPESVGVSFKRARYDRESAGHHGLPIGEGK